LEAAGGPLVDRAAKVAEQASGPGESRRARRSVRAAVA
jgi:hypothetical protein